MIKLRLDQATPGYASKKWEKCKARFHSRAYISATTGRIDMGLTPVRRELIGLANPVSFGDWRVARALLIYFRWKFSDFWRFSRMILALGDRERWRDETNAIFQRNVLSLRCVYNWSILLCIWLWKSTRKGHTINNWRLSVITLR